MVHLRRHQTRTGDRNGTQKNGFVPMKGDLTFDSFIQLYVSAARSPLLARRMEEQWGVPLGL